MAAKHTKAAVDHGPTGFIAFVAWVGALAYFVGQADGLWNVIVAFFQACVWPAYVVYYGLQALIG
jgi:hypothetical protein